MADESVSALDVSIKAQVCNVLMDLQEEFNLAFLFISHDMAVVERISHRVSVMYLGEIVEIGPRAAIFDNPQHDYTKELLAAVPVPDPERRGLRRSAAIDELKARFGQPATHRPAASTAKSARGISYSCLEQQGRRPSSHGPFPASYTSISGTYVFVHAEKKPLAKRNPLRRPCHLLGLIRTSADIPNRA